jgi:hypothetical protein
MFNILQNRNDYRYNLEENDIKTEISINSNDVDDDSDNDDDKDGKDYCFKINNNNLNQVYDTRKVAEKYDSNRDHSNENKLQKNDNKLIRNEVQDIHHIIILHDIINHCICSCSVDIIRELFYELLALYMVSNNDKVTINEKEYTDDTHTETCYDSNSRTGIHSKIKSKPSMSRIPKRFSATKSSLSKHNLYRIFYYNYYRDIQRDSNRRDHHDSTITSGIISKKNGTLIDEKCGVFDKDNAVIDVVEDIADDVQPKIPFDGDDYDESNHSFYHGGYINDDDENDHDNGDDDDDDDDKDNQIKDLCSRTTTRGGDKLISITSNEYMNAVNLYSKDKEETDIAMSSSDKNIRKNNNEINTNINNNYHRKSKFRNMRIIRGEKKNKVKRSSSSSSSSSSKNNNHLPTVLSSNDGDNDDHHELPSGSNSSSSTIPLFFRIPQLLTGIIFKERVVDLINFNGEEAKYDLIQEMAVHILIDSLLLTVTAIPIVNSSIPTDCNHFICRISVSLTYITFNIQIWTVTLHAIIAFALLEIPYKLFKDWLIHRKEVLYTVARMHVFGLYTFVVNILVWPLAKYDTFYQVICTFISLFVWIVVFLMMGTAVTNGVFDSLNPTIKLKGKPNNKKIQAIIESDKIIFQSFLQKTKGGEKKKKILNPTIKKDLDMNTFLDQLHLSHLLPIFEEENINIELLSMLDHHDFRHLHICVADRIKIHKALHHSPSYLLHLYNHQKK